MKRFLLVFAFLLSVMEASAQVYSFRTYAYSHMEAGSSWSKWEISDLAVTFNLDSDIIKINNRLNSSFYVYSSTEDYTDDGEWCLKCTCTDEEQIRCTVRLMVRKNGTRQLYVDYRNQSWCYNIKLVN